VTFSGSRITGTMRLSSISSSAREVFFGNPPGIGLLMKWMTCALIGACRGWPADASPVPGSDRATSPPDGETLRPVTPVDHQASW